jgi:hypothetical protein
VVEEPPARPRKPVARVAEDDDDEPRPRRRREDDEDYEEARGRRVRRRDDYGDEDYDDEAEDDEDYRSRRRGEKPGKVVAVAIMMLIGGILAIISSVAILAYLGLAGAVTCGVGWLGCLWPGPYYSLVLGILATIKGSQLLGRNADRLPPPKGVAIMQIINIVNLDIPNCVMGIIALIFLNEREVQRYFRG